MMQREYDRCLIIKINSALLFFLLFGGYVHAGELPACLMQPAYVSIPIPEKKFIDIFEREMEIPCKRTPADSWIVNHSNQASLFVNAEGPSGSGRYWTINVGIGEVKQKEPARGFCMQTSTIGWRTLQNYKSPLMWNDDLDGDGKSELIIWDSFPLHTEASSAESGLTAWVYRLDDNSILELDLGLSRNLALDIARNYRIELKTDKELEQLRGKAKNALEAFGRKECAVGKQEFK